jgi:hypothetical protein
VRFDHPSTVIDQPLPQLLMMSTQCLPKGAVPSRLAGRTRSPSTDQLALIAIARQPDSLPKSPIA